MKVVIIGGVAGGASAAARLRRLDEEAEIVLLERGDAISYANCGLPYYIGGDITEEGALTVQTPQGFRSRFRIDVRTGEEAVSIDRERKSVAVRKKNGAIYTEAYDVLLLSPGAEPVRPPLPGLDDPRVFTLRTIPDTLRIKRFIEEKRPRTALVVGGGYIGAEMAENLARAGLQVTIAELADHLIPPLDYDMACGVHQYLRSKGIRLLLKTGLSGLIPEAGGLRANLGTEAPLFDMVLLSVGVRPDTRLAREAGLPLNSKGAILVDEHMRTADPAIYAVGDAVEIRERVTGGAGYIPLAGPANKQGRIAADNIAGGGSVYRGTQGSAVLKLFDMTVATTGINEETARRAGIPFDKVYTLSPSHATYYPGATNISLKLLFEQGSGRLLGAQLTGFDGVDKRCDVLATAVRAGMTAFDLTELELAYAPPYSSAKDPVNMAGFVAENVLTGKVKQYHWHDVDTLPRGGAVTLLDVRTSGEYARGHIEGARHIPLDSLRSRLAELDKGKPVYVNCQSGLRSYIACRILTQAGFDCFNLAGGYRLYESVIRETSFDTRPAGPCGLPL